MGVTTLAALALAGAGTGMSIAANQSTTDAENQAITDALNQQKGYIGATTDTFQKSLSEGTPDVSSRQIAAGQEKYKGDYAKADTVPTATSPAGTTQASRVLNEQAAQQTATSNQQRAMLGGYTEWDLNQWIKNIEAQKSINLTNAISRAQEEVLPYKLYDASHSEDNTKTWGSILSALGSVVGAAGPAMGGETFSQIAPTTATTLSNQQKASKSLDDYINAYGPKKTEQSTNYYSPYDWSANPLNT